MSLSIRYSEFDAKLKTSFRPRRCLVSGKLLWFKVCYKITASYETKTDYKLKHVFWMSTTEYLILSIKGGAN